MTAFLLLAMITATAADRPEIIVADFESETYAPWTTTGAAFGPGPARGALPGQMAVGDYLGQRLVNSFFQGDDTEGRLVSPEFRIGRKMITFLVGGGRHPGETCINLLVDGNKVRTTTGPDSEFLILRAWDVTEFAGKMAMIEIVDTRKGQWGHISVDQIVQTDSAPPTVDERTTLLAKAEASMKIAAEKVKNDPRRPTYHVLPPANWSNDPNGPIFYKGYYHLFYQLNPYGDDWGHMHWGHVRSRDLAQWEHLPIALWPSRSDGEQHVFSGCATLDRKGVPMIFYTSIGQPLPQQWAAVPESDDLLLWKKHPKNPILTEDLHGSTKIWEWRDPFIFHHDGQTYMVAGGNVHENKTEVGIVNVYRADDPTLTKWTSLGILFRHPDAAVKNVECPLFFPIGDKWVLIVSQGMPVHWFVGSLDPKSMQFHAEKRGILDAGQVYAPNVLERADAAPLLWGWVRDFPKGMGWNGAMTLPRVLGISREGELTARPAPEIEKLRDRKLAVSRDKKVENGDSEIAEIHGVAIEIRATLDRGDAQSCGLIVRRSADGKHGIPIEFDGKTLSVAGSKTPVAGDAKSVGLRIFVDHSILEVYTDAGQATTRTITAEPGDAGMAAFAKGGTATVKDLEAWPIRSIWHPEDH